MLDTSDLPGLDKVRKSLEQEADELTKIFGKIVRNLERDGN